MKKLITALMFALVLLSVVAGTALVEKNTIRISGRDELQRNCVVLPHAAENGATTAAASSDHLAVTHPADPCPIVIIIDPS